MDWNKAEKIVLVPIGDIKLNPKNRNKHSAEQIKRLAKIISFQGFREPGTISNLSGFLVAGEGRYLAAKELALPSLPCIFQNFDDEDQEYAYGVSTNAISAWAELDLSTINADLSELDGMSFDIDLLGLKDFELEPADKLTDDDIEKEESDDPEDVIPELPTEPISKLGDKLQIGNHLIKCGDSFEFLKTLEENSIDSVVTDPPYGISFMNKKWDYSVPKVDLWKEVLRVLKPGGHALIACGTRTQHRMVLNIEDAGFEVRDVVTWLYGTGFPKSLNLGPGLGTALKPACEFWTLVRKPISESTIAKNVQKWGTGGINIDGCRVAVEGQETQGRFPANLILDETAAEMLDGQSVPLMHSAGKTRSGGKAIQSGEGGLLAMGNHDGNGVRFGDSGGASRFFYVAKASRSERNAGLEGMPLKRNDVHDNPSRMSGSSGVKSRNEGMDMSGTAGNQNFHPTVKPIKLIQYLVRLITAPNGLVLDCFLGSGTTAIACEREGFRSVGCELDPAHFDIITGRIKNCYPNQKE